MSDACPVPPVPEAPAAPKVEDIKFPVLDKGPAVFYDDGSHQVWLGIPFKMVDNPLFVLTALDRAKQDVLMYLSRHQAEMMKAEHDKRETKNKFGLGPLKNLFDKAGKLIK